MIKGGEKYAEICGGRGWLKKTRAAIPGMELRHGFMIF